MTVRAARRRGVVARFVTPRGAAVVRAVLVRGSGSRRVVVARRAIVARPGRRQAARFTGATVRRALRPGRYAVEIRPRGVRPAATVRATLRIVR